PPGAPKDSGGTFRLTCKLRPSSPDIPADEDRLFDYTISGKGNAGNGSTYTATLANTRGHFSATIDSTAGNGMFSPALHITVNGTPFNRDSRTGNYDISITPGVSSGVMGNIVAPFASLTSKGDLREYADTVDSATQTACYVGGSPKPDGGS